MGVTVFVDVDLLPIKQRRKNLNSPILIQVCDSLHGRHEGPGAVRVVRATMDTDDNARDGRGAFHQSSRDEKRISCRNQSRPLCRRTTPLSFHKLNRVVLCNGLAISK
jgi:hypothetical protein